MVEDDVGAQFHGPSRRPGSHSGGFYYQPGDLGKLDCDRANLARDADDQYGAAAVPAVAIYLHAIKESLPSGDCRQRNRRRLREVQALWLASYDALVDCMELAVAPGPRDVS